MANRNFVNLNINPCKMCMPMGAAMAFKGIENSMVILHGSQGCSTYIRRHMATHFNEPIDVASSSLTEDGTVFGGESNLLKGLKNLVQQYSPRVIGIATTCLAETIGEDIERLVKHFSQEPQLSSVKLVPISTPGYGGSQTEGYAAALLSIVKHLAVKNEPHVKINIVTSSMSPADTRQLKAILELFEVDYILLPDNSETLDAPYEKEYRRLPLGGTPYEDIACMPGARATIELGLTHDESLSCGEYLKQHYGVPLYRCALPIGIQNTDAFVNVLASLTGKPVPEVLSKARGRLIDAMIDSHKYNAMGKAIIFGEPELVYGITRICAENGIKPLVVSTGSVNKKLAELVSNESKEIETLDDTDFEMLEKLAAKYQANILIGNSDGKIITEHLGIPLVRVGFPIHDRVGGQRLVTTFYEGSMRLLDEITNTLLERKHQHYRQDMLDRYFNGEAEIGDNKTDQPSQVIAPVEKQETSIEIKTKEHPCFGKGACHNARIHIPVAPACNISCNYCNRKFDCVNESRPGVTSRILSPEEAKNRFLLAKGKLDNLKVVGIAGPGDALANIEKTRESIRLIREIDPEITFCLSTNGLMLPYYADELVDLGVTHFTVTVNAVDLSILAKIYREINFMGLKLTGEAGCRILLENQLAGIKQLVRRGVVVKVNIVMIKGVNDQHIEKVVEAVKECGVFMTNIMPLIPAKGSQFENYPQTSQVELNEMRKKCGQMLSQMYHCRQCRADAVGTLDHDICHEFGNKTPKAEEAMKSTVSRSYRFAVTTHSGMMVDQHFGQAKAFSVYEINNGKIRFIESRDVKQYCDGQDNCEEGQDKIDRIMQAIWDCAGVITMRIGLKPEERLTQEKGMAVFKTCGSIHECLMEAVSQMEKAKHPEAAGISA